MIQKMPLLACVTGVLVCLTSCKQSEQNRCCASDDMCAVINNPDLTNTDKLVLVAEHVDGITEENVHCTLGTRNPPHYENVNYIISGEFLYWRATEDAMTYAEEFIEKSPGNFEHKEYAAKLPWDMGFRLGIGYIFDCWDNWDLFLNYTWFSSEKTRSEKNNLSNSSAVLVPKQEGIAPTLLSVAEAEWRLHYNIVDLELGRNYFLSKNLCLRPYMAIRTAIINQKLDLDFEGIYGELTPSPSGIAESNFKNNFHGAGVRAGGDLLWHFTRDFAIAGKISGSLLYGTLFLDQDNTGNIASSSPSFFGPITIDKDYKYGKVQPNLELSGGFAWEREMDNCSRVAVSVMYDFSEWFSFNQLLLDNYAFTLNGGTVVNQSTVNRSSGDLGLNGFSFKLRFDF